MILKPIIEKYINNNEFREFIEILKKDNSTGSLSIEGVSPSSFPIIISSIFSENPKQILVVTKNIQRMQEIYLDLTCFINEDFLFKLPSWETLPYEYISASENVERDRITSIYRLISEKPGIIITTIESLIRQIPDKKFFINKGLTLDIGDDYPFDDIIELLVDYGYSREYRVDAFGHFTVKGGLIDIFLPSYENPIRLDFFGDTLDSIREFDIGTQISNNQLKSITIYPRKELILLEKEKEKLYDILEEKYSNGISFPDELENQLKDGELNKINGIEDIFHLAINPSPLYSYLSKESNIIFIDESELISQKNMIYKTFTDLYNKRQSKTLCLEPDKLLHMDSYEKASANAIQLKVFTTSTGAFQWQLKSIPNFHGKIKEVREEINRRITDGWDIIVTTGFEGQARRLYDLLGVFNPDKDFENINPENQLNILISPFREGLEIISEKLMVLTDHEIFGKSYRKKKQFKKKTSRPIESFIDLKTGDLVVHINHGIGIFQGIERMTAGGVERDFLMIEYADGDKLYVSLDQITMVQKYIGFEGRNTRIDHLGKKSAWNKIKKRVKESVELIAKELIEIYSKRNALKGFQYPPDTEWQEEFESLFEYEETPDQITAIEDVKDDMELPKPMDRLICGDVGFGKTEVAIRASFKSVMAGKQVAILVPTTILAMQHYSSFGKRFSNYPIEVEMISRFRTAREIREIKEKLKEGQIDIIIGTHALLSKDVKIKNIGLLIIDEEQRFGVKHKEQLKKLRSQVDVMTLSATPIPRTLHMSMAGIRDLSIITTPPENRQAIDTYVLEENPDVLRNAILKEIDREGQVFFVHNRVQTIDAQAVMLEKLVPEASFCVAHGQMGENELEEIIIDFLNKKFEVLISTTIIESGLDMPNVNTIIINRSDTFGLSQLYQLKGRVGRSIKKAYAYLFYPKHTSLTEDAQKRLQVISEYSELGSGFKIAMKDLEIRGAGNILGKEQSGNIMEVGFDLYTQMLEDAVNLLKGEKPSILFRTPVFFKTDFYIPGEYIKDERQKIEFYKRLESSETTEEVDQVVEEMKDRFGEPPEKVKILVELEKIRTIASSLFIDEILEESRAIRIKISEQSKIDRTILIKELAKDKRLSIDKKDNEVLLFKTHSNSSEKKLHELKKWLQQII